MKSALLLMAAIIIALLLPSTAESINDFRTAEYTEPHIVTTAPAVTTSDITLSQSLFSDATANVEITSNNTADAPIPLSYVKATKVLTVSGLSADDVRNLSIIYKIDDLADDLGAGLSARILLTLYVLGIFGLIGGAVYQATRRGSD